ncbi:HAD family hydrolase [Candidatus Contubernalis alkaliaceticus]|uniref:HAD family hydrolase n=1 Tax=Candidatus Contubernalis alkaliaceticus TaxID=338645 RepID=UPI001F4C245B|nr:HAD family hydrolase [Candidatus Contubernalis alkalaceticus]UNC93645.1 HAD family hydrolase [Candidatus Contubernalis alkalaceticus]
MRDLLSLIKEKNVQAVIFDVDGTLYDQKKLRRLMFFAVIKYYSIRPWRLKEIKVLQDFRGQREKNASVVCQDIEKVQYEWGAKASGVSPEQVKKVTAQWIFQYPLKYLYRCRYPGVCRFMEKLKEQKIITAVFSDYPAAEKLSALQVSPHHIFSSTDKNIDRLKPDPKGLLVAARSLNIPVEYCLFVGDREDRDGECARRAGMPYYILQGDLDFIP